MKYVSVESSQIAEVGFGDGLFGPETLGIKFHPGKRSAASEYHYGGVSSRTHQALMAAASIGTYFGQNIKARPDLYPYQKADSLPKTEAPSLFPDKDDDTPSPSTALAIIDTTADDVLFTPNAITDAQLAAGREWYLTEAKKYEITTEKGRTEFKRFARPLQKLRTGIEARAKELTGATKRKIAAIDAEKRRLIAIVGGIEDEVLRPLKEYEHAEDERINQRNEAIEEIRSAGPYTAANWMNLTVEAMEDRIKEIESDTRQWPELGKMIDAARADAVAHIRESIAKRKSYDAEQAELAKLRKDAAERAEQDRLAAVAKDAREQAERAAAAELQRAESERQAAEQRAREAEERAAAAVEAERKRRADDADAEYAAMEARAADAKHRQTIMDEVAECLMGLSLTRMEAMAVVCAIADREVPHVTISF